MACSDDDSSNTFSISLDIPSSSSMDTVMIKECFFDEGFGCNSAKDVTTEIVLEYDSLSKSISRFDYPGIGDGVDKACEKANAEKTDDQTVTCDSIVTISYKPLENVSACVIIDSLVTELCALITALQ